MEQDKLVFPMADGRIAFSGVVSMDEIVAICDDYLKNLHCTLWGSGFDVITPYSRNRAANFLASSMVEALS